MKFNQKIGLFKIIRLLKAVPLCHFPIFFPWRFHVLCCTSKNEMCLLRVNVAEGCTLIVWQVSFSAIVIDLALLRI